ncbi:hypothetical protein EYF80_031000 [Liparis tanakae]|uniref:Uncharacterized protein n=1 Tax=Liparis tanakae TaxID=230148 RepID=A0A4Z2H071_9TELE|nr:hypothetical protein EYF80_031000 [Liparis tanakae]
MSWQGRRTKIDSISTPLGLHSLQLRLNSGSTRHTNTESVLSNAETGPSPRFLLNPNATLINNLAGRVQVGDSQTAVVFRSSEGTQRAELLLTALKNTSISRVTLPFNSAPKSTFFSGKAIVCPLWIWGTERASGAELIREPDRSSRGAAERSEMETPVHLFTVTKKIKHMSSRMLPMSSSMLLGSLKGKDISLCLKEKKTITEGDAGGAHEVISGQIAVVHLQTPTQRGSVHAESITETTIVMRW